MSADGSAKLKVCGASVSYYTGKLEAYLRYKGIDYERLPLQPWRREVEAALGVSQMPCVRRPDGRWMTDTTPIIASLEEEYPDPGVFPPDPVVRFLALLIEDYADEWLWRPAMHYRWSYEHDRVLLSRVIVDDELGHIPAPRFLKILLVKTRQRLGFVIRDGVSRKTRDHVESGYRAALRHMSRMLASRPFLLGESPSIADFGLMGPMLRHFGQDPTPVEIMRNEAPAVYAWVARTWDARGHEGGPDFVSEFPDEGRGFLEEIAATHLVQLAANAEAVRAGKRRFPVTIQGCRYPNLPASPYRAWCLSQLGEEFGTLTGESKEKIRALLKPEAVEILEGARSLPEKIRGLGASAPYGESQNVYPGAVPLR